MAYACVKPVEISAISETNQIVNEGRVTRAQKGRPNGRRNASVRVGSRGKRRTEKLVRAATDCPQQLPADDETRDPFFHKSYKPPTCAFGSSGATLERSSLDLSEYRTQQEAKTDDNGGGGNNGKDIHNGGGGDGDDSDDDGWFEDDDGEDGDDNGFFRRRTAIPELFDARTIQCVLQEWYKTLTSLPDGLRRAVEMGLVSSAQLIRFVSTTSRPSIARAVSKILPESQSRAFIGRLMGDPLFPFKIVVDQLITGLFALGWEINHRGDRFIQELDLASVNIASMMACNAAAVWCLTANRSFGSPQKFAMQRLLHSLPNNIFDKSGPLREYTIGTRVMGFFSKGVQLAMIGASVGLVSSLITSALVERRKSAGPGASAETSVPVVPLTTAVASSAALAGLNANIRNQMMAGADRYMLQNFGSLNLVFAGTAMLRFLSNRVGEGVYLPSVGLDKVPVKELPSATQVLYTLPIIAPLLAMMSNRSKTKSKKKLKKKRRTKRKVKRTDEEASLRKPLPTMA